MEPISQFLTQIDISREGYVLVLLREEEGIPWPGDPTPWLSVVSGATLTRWLPPSLLSR